MEDVFQCARYITTWWYWCPEMTVLCHPFGHNTQGSIYIFWILVLNFLKLSMVRNCQCPFLVFSDPGGPRKFVSPPPQIHRGFFSPHKISIKKVHVNSLQKKVHSNIPSQISTCTLCSRVRNGPPLGHGLLPEL